MFQYEETLDYDIESENYIKDLQELFKTLSNNGEVLFSEVSQAENISRLSCARYETWQKEPVLIQISAEYDVKCLHKIKLKAIPDSNDVGNYENDLKLFYLEYIKGALLDAVNRKKEKYTLRIYKTIYNTSSIKGSYSINDESYKIVFHTLNEIEKAEPLTEHVICFDIEVMERNFERARSLALNLVTDFSSALSVLLDVGFHEPYSKFLNFIDVENVLGEKSYLHKRFRTAFYDQELKIIVKDNFNGLCPEKEMKNGNFLNGYYSVSKNDDTACYQMETGRIKAIEETFSNHRIYKLKGKMGVMEDTVSELDETIHYPNSPIKIPQKIRAYFRGINACRKDNFEKYKYFRNACRLYNQSKILAINSTSMEISLMVASIEALSKTEGKKSFSDFIIKYNSKADRKTTDAIYAIRSKLFHGGDFSFFEYDMDINPYSNPLYNEFQRKYIIYKSIMRKAFVNWSYRNLMDDE